MNFIIEKLKKEKAKIEINNDLTTPKPFIPYNQEIFEIPQNLSEGTYYGINTIINNNDTVGEKINKLQITLNNITEILSFLILRQLPEISENIINYIEKIQIQKITQSSNLEVLSIVEQLSREIDAPIEEKDIIIHKVKEILLKQNILIIKPPFRIA